MSIKNRSKQEVEGLLAHKLPVGKASQLSDTFVLGMRFEQSLSQSHDMVPTFTKQDKVISELEEAMESIYEYASMIPLHLTDENNHSNTHIKHFVEQIKLHSAKHKQSKGE